MLQTHQASQFGMVSILVSCDILFLLLRRSSSFLTLQQQHQQKQQALGRWEFCVLVMPRPPPAPLSAEVSLRPPPMASSPPRSAGIGPVTVEVSRSTSGSRVCTTLLEARTAQG
ncbi:hypothetical protein EYF80_009721 [Liparis tanakae]|uniref:Uncharacterized protein n=1 Tax=Liparis tanakae TaxID=230148 RepID=A0A4Z2IQ25_9TELE|nr:hypothetical protein EYF80_009721 [Liparis tanakae]